MDTAAAASEWPDLPADLLRDISERLRDPVDFIRFHAVCKPWRDAAPPSPSPFLPLLLAPGESLWSKPGPLLRSVFSNTAWQAYRVTSSSYKWLSRVDGGGTLLLSTGGYAPDLVDPLTGAVIARLPRFPDEIACYLQSFPDGVVLADGTIVMYVVEAFLKNSGPVLAAAVLRPGDTAWTAVLEPLQTGAYFGIRSTPALVNGEIVLADFLGQCAIKIKLRVAGGMADMIQRECELDDPAGDPVWTPHSYILESRGELLSVHITYVEGIGEGQWRTAGRAGAVSVSLHALELGPDNGSSPRWVRRDGLSLADRVLFLGHPASFAVDAARLGGAVEGGCAYFVVNWSRHLFWTTLLLPEVCLVYKYSFLDGSATVVAELYDGWEKERTFMWFVPQIVTMATTQEIRERLHNPKKRNSGPRRSIVLNATTRRFGPYFKIYVGNLPWKVDNSRLRQFFSRHGQVADATVVYDRATRCSRGFGFVTMASMEEPAVAVAALNGQVLDGRALRVSFAEERQWQEPYMPMLLLPQQPPIYFWWWW